MAGRTFTHGLNVDWQQDVGSVLHYKCEISDIAKCLEKDSPTFFV